MLLEDLPAEIYQQIEDIIADEVEVDPRSAVAGLENGLMKNRQERTMVLNVIKRQHEVVKRNANGRMWVSLAVRDRLMERIIWMAGPYL